MMSEFSDGLAVKIGKTLDVKRRFKEIQANTPSLVVLVFAFHGSADCEALLHKHFAKDRIHNEWFRYSERLDDLKTAVMARLGSVLNEMKLDALHGILNELGEKK